jgi:tetratricopeptide (TPR) repeat protein
MACRNRRSRIRAGALACLCGAHCCVGAVFAETNSATAAAAWPREDRPGWVELALQLVQQLQAKQQATLRAVEQARLEAEAASRRNAERLEMLLKRMERLMIAGALLAVAMAGMVFYARSLLRSVRAAAPSAPPAAVTGQGAGESVALARLLLARGEALLGRKQPASALDCFNQAIALDERRATAHLRKAAALETLGRLEEALAAYERALALDATLMEAYVGKGNVLNRLRRYGEALACYERAAGAARAGASPAPAAQSRAPARRARKTSPPA